MSDSRIFCILAPFFSLRVSFSKSLHFDHLIYVRMINDPYSIRDHVTSDATITKSTACNLIFSLFILGMSYMHEKLQLSLLAESNA